MTPAQRYAVQVDAGMRQFTGVRPPGLRDPLTPGLAHRAREDPRRPLDANRAALASYVEPGDVIVDVGGGAGRVGLPLALRCREVISVDPSPAMRAEFEESAREAGIANARYAPAGWPTEPIIEGDVVLATHVTYFVRDIVPFIRGMEAAARRRVVICLASIPPPSQGAAVYELLRGQPLAWPPGHRELLAVLWDLDILPDVRVLPVALKRIWSWPAQPTRERMVEAALQVLPQSGSLDLGRARALLEDRFEALFVPGDEGYDVRWPTTREVRELLITWEPRR